MKDTTLDDKSIRDVLDSLGIPHDKIAVVIINYGKIIYGDNKTTTHIKQAGEDNTLLAGDHSAQIADNINQVSDNANAESSLKHATTNKLNPCHDRNRTHP